MRSCVDGCFTKFTCLLTLCTVSRQTHLAVAGKQTSSVNDVIHYECMIDRTLHVRKISGNFPEKFRKVSDILFFRKTYNPTLDQLEQKTPWHIIFLYYQSQQNSFFYHIVTRTVFLMRLSIHHSLSNSGTTSYILKQVCDLS